MRFYLLSPNVVVQLKFVQREAQRVHQSMKVITALVVMMRILEFQKFVVVQVSGVQTEQKENVHLVYMEQNLDTRCQNVMHHARKDSFVQLVLYHQYHVVVLINIVQLEVLFLLK